MKLELQSKHYWAPSVQSIAYDGNYIAKFSHPRTNWAILDTGATYLHIPTKYYMLLANIWQSEIDSSVLFNNSNGVFESKEPCDKIESLLSNFSIVLDNHRFTLSPRSYLLSCDSLPSALCSSHSHCLLAINSMDTELGAFNERTFVLGETFLRNYYVVFNATESDPNVGMAVGKNYEYFV